MEIHRSDILLFACERIICSPKNCATSEPKKNAEQLLDVFFLLIQLVQTLTGLR